MPTVAVDLEDLETLVSTTGALKVIEGALQARKTDAFVQPHLNFTEAHNRLALAMRNARRAEAGTAIGWDDPLDAEELDILGDISEDSSYWVNPQARLETPAIDSLAAKGCVVLGQFVEGIIWAGASAPEVKLNPKGFPVKLTDRGRQALAKAKG